MPSIQFHKLAVRDGQSSTDAPNSTTYHLMIALLALFGFISGLLLVLFVIIPSIRRSKQKSESSQPRRLTIDTSNTAAFVVQEKQYLLENSSTPSSPSPVPEIRITLPDEVDKSGRPQSGRVVIVRLGENSSVGLEPVHDQLPPYQKEDAGFSSLDLEKMGGLKEFK